MHTSRNSDSLSASDLGKFLICRHSTALDLAVAKGLRAKPPKYPDPVLELLIARGFEHEQRFVDIQREKGLTVVDLKGGEDGVARTIEAMKQGADLIVQGQVDHDGWGGYPDVLRRIETTSPNLGDWSYEVIDTKLTKETKGTTILQLALYSEIVGIIQGMTPEFFYVVTPEKEESYRFNDYAAYYRLVKRGLAAAVTRDPEQLAAEHYPEPVDHCDLCRWEMDCKRKRRADDHLSLVAGISRLQRRELEPRGVTTLEALGTMLLPLTPKPDRGSPATYERVREQARVQLEGRQRNTNIHELLLPVKEGDGLTRLPEPSPGDVFLDLEGEPFSRDGGREYLFGLVTVDAKGNPTYEGYWAFSDETECVAFESVMDRIMAAWKQHPGMHVYHYAPYEPSAFKRLMGRYATRESDVDRLLRGGRFIDLHGVVKQGLRASVEKYSIKDLEKFYGFARETDLRKAGDHRALIDRCLQTDSVEAITDEDRAIIEAYNKDDCVSTLRLRDWLEKLRAELVTGGTEVPRPKPREDAAAARLKERELHVLELIKTLTTAVSLDPKQRSAEEHARWLLAHMLDYHRREDKVVWWEYFELQDLEEDDRIEALQVITGLEFVEHAAMAKTRATDRYKFPVQPCQVTVGDDVHDSDGKFGEVVSMDLGAGMIDILKSGKRTADHPPNIFAHNYIPPAPRPEALIRVAESVIANGMSGAAPYRAARSLLMREMPRLREAEFEQVAGENTVDFAVRIVTRLDGTVLPIQGPPGSGKTYTGARMICELVRSRNRVAVTANSHVVIRNLLDKVLEQARVEGVALTCGHRRSAQSSIAGDIVEFDSNEDALDALRSGDIHVLGGTSWLWAREDAMQIADVLVVDEAGQMALPNVIACGGTADSIVLLGDPQQLEQPKKGSHPDGTAASALAHILEGHSVIPPDRGIFIPETWRMHPSICGFCSEVFYEGKLTARPELVHQRLSGAAPFDGAGLWLVPVEHVGNQNDSPQEVEAVTEIVTTLLNEKAHWVDAGETPHPITPADILVISPYNLQVMALQAALEPLGVTVGTVDRFQGRQAPVVIYSMASSSPSDASRGMEFLYSLSRLNVATSRARCATILVASPSLFGPECKSPRQMKLANALCRYVEMARRVE